jgi:hypothetical protein
VTYTQYGVDSDERITGHRERWAEIAARVVEYVLVVGVNVNTSYIPQYSERLKQTQGRKVKEVFLF